MTLLSHEHTGTYAITRRLADANEALDGRIQVRVLPLISEANVASGNGPATILQFAHAFALGVVYVAGLRRDGVCLTQHADTALYLKAFTQMRGAKGI